MPPSDRMHPARGRSRRFVANFAQPTERLDTRKTQNWGRVRPVGLEPTTFGSGDIGPQWHLEDPSELCAVGGLGVREMDFLQVAPVGSLERAGPGHHARECRLGELRKVVWIGGASTNHEPPRLLTLSNRSRFPSPGTSIIMRAYRFSCTKASSSDSTA